MATSSPALALSSGPSQFFNVARFWNFYSSGYYCVTYCIVLQGFNTVSFVHIQFDALRQYIDIGGCVLVMMTEGGEVKHNTNVNFLLEELGVMVNNGK